MMAVTMYRCSRCKGLFSSVFGIGREQLCRACKTGDQAGSVPGGVTIIEAEDNAAPVVVNPSTANAMFFTTGGAFDYDGGIVSRLEQLNDITRQVLEKRPELGIYAGTVDEVMQIAPRATVNIPNMATGEMQEFVNESDEPIDIERLANGKLALSRPVYRRFGSLVFMVDLIDAIAEKVEDLPSEPEAKPQVAPSPHAAMLSPRRKLRISEK